MTGRDNYLVCAGSLDRHSDISEIQMALLCYDWKKNGGQKPLTLQNINNFLVKVSKARYIAGAIALTVGPVPTPQTFRPALPLCQGILHNDKNSRCML